jgi:hypothetical protein
MQGTMVRFPFEATLTEITADPGPYIDAIFTSLGSEFMTMPKGPGFVEYPTFEEGYESLKRATSGFSDNSAPKLLLAAVDQSMSLVVIRTILGLTPPEWGFTATQHTGIRITQNSVRSLDRRIRMEPDKPLTSKDLENPRMMALIETASHLLNIGSTNSNPTELHRFDKVDTRHDPSSIRDSANLGIPYALLLYERFLVRPFAGHRDSISDLIGNVLEADIKNVLNQAGISFRETKRAVKINGFDQSPDFIVPSELTPQIVSEAKICEDDGTARDKVTRIQHLRELANERGHGPVPRFEVIACIGGRGFGVRRADMQKLFDATQGKVFTFQTLNNMVEFSRLKEFMTK